MPAFPADGHGHSAQGPLRGQARRLILTDRMTWCGRPAAARLRTLRRLGPLRRWLLQCRMAFPFGLVALAAGKHPFPSRTRPLRLHAVMILRPGARESNASPILILQIPCPLEGRGFFCFPRISRGSRSPRISRISGASRNSRNSASARRRGRRRDRRRFAARVAPPGLKSPLSAFRGFAPLSRRFTPG